MTITIKSESPITIIGIRTLVRRAIIQAGVDSQRKGSHLFRQHADSPIMPTT